MKLYTIRKEIQTTKNLTPIEPKQEFGIYVNSFRPRIDFEKSGDKTIAVATLPKPVKYGIFAFSILGVIFQLVVFGFVICGKETLSFLAFLPVILVAAANLLASVCFRISAKIALNNLELGRLTSRPPI